MCLTLYEKRAKRYVFQDWLKEFNAQNGTDIKGLVLPVAHPRLNPIEMCWGNAKNHVARSCHNFTMDGVIGLFKEHIAAQGRENFWKKSYVKMVEEMNLYIRADEKILETGGNDDSDDGEDPDDHSE